MVKGAARSEATEDYLKAIYLLRQSEHGPVTVSAIALRLGVSAAAASAMVKRLTSRGLVRHERYRGVALSAEGERVAVEILRHHRLLEQYLALRLGLELVDVHEEAERLEHVLSEELEARIDRELGFPTHDPHGHPIPDAELNLPPAPAWTLGDLSPGERAVIRQVPDGDRRLLHYLSTLGLLPGRTVELHAAAPFDGPLVLRAGGAECAVSRELAMRVAVEPER